MFRLFGSPLCGNNFVEEGEQCDCGIKELCNNPCCNSETCKFFENATCATGQCCDLNVLFLINIFIFYIIFKLYCIFFRLALLSLLVQNVDQLFMNVIYLSIVQEIRSIVLIMFLKLMDLLVTKKKYFYRN